MIRALTLIGIGAASFAAVYVLMPPGTESDAPEQVAPVPQVSEALVAPAPDATLSPPDASASAGFELRPGAEPVRPLGNAAPRAIRDVTPDNMTAGPRITGTLVRVDPPAKQTQARTERLFNPIVVAAGTIKARGADIHLAGIAAPEFDAQCGEGAKAWPCGRMARAALRGFIRGRAIECEIPAGADKIPDPAECLVGGDSISKWLVSRGWAKRGGDTYESMEKAAREAKLGLWSDKRPDGQTEVAIRG
jgi:endonuclease YncB( thermonuclease family)